MSSFTTVGIIASITNQLTERKKAFIRELAWDIESQATLWEKHKERVLATLTDEEGKKLRKLLKQLRAREQELAKKKAKEQEKANRALGKGNNISPQLKEKKAKEAARTRAILQKTKGKGYKVMPTSVKEHQAEMETLRLKRLELQVLVNEILAQKKKVEKEAEIARKKEEDRKRTEAHKIKLLREKQERDLWNERGLLKQQALVERYSMMDHGTEARAVPMVVVPKERTNIEKEISKLECQLEQLLG